MPRLVTMAAVVGIAIADQRGWLLAPPSDASRYDGALARLLHVTDDGALEVVLLDGLSRGGRARVGLLGVAPVAPTGAGRGGAVGAFALAAVDGTAVRLRLDGPRTRDAAGRVLAHVDLRDGTCLNERLLVAGLVRCDERWPHAMLGRYARLERLARRSAIGVWSAVASDDTRRASDGG